MLIKCAHPRPSQEGVAASRRPQDQDAAGPTSSGTCRGVLCLSVLSLKREKRSPAGARKGGAVCAAAGSSSASSSHGTLGTPPQAYSEKDPPHGFRTTRWVDVGPPSWHWLCQLPHLPLMVVLATFSHIHLRPQPQVPSAARALLTGQPQRPEGAAPRLLVSRCPDPATLLLAGLVAVPVSRTHGKKSDVCAEAWPPPSQQEVLGDTGTWAQRVRPCLSGATRFPAGISTLAWL